MEVFRAQFTSSCSSRYNVCVCFARAIFLPYRLIKGKVYCCEKYEVGEVHCKSCAVHNLEAMTGGKNLGLPKTLGGFLCRTAE